MKQHHLYRAENHRFPPEIIILKTASFLQVCNMTSVVVVESTVTFDCAVLSFLENILSYNQSLCETRIFT